MPGATRSLPLLATAAAVGLVGGASARYVAYVRDHRESQATAIAAPTEHLATPANGGTSAKRASAGLSAAAAAEALESIFHSRSADRLHRLALFLPRADAAAVEGLARHFCDPKTEEDGDLCVRLVLARWVEIDPAGTVAFCRTVPLRRNDAFGPFHDARDTLVGHAFEAWGRINYAAALAAADTPSTRVRAIVGLSSTDPLRAFAELETRGSFFGGQAWLPWGELIARLGAIDPARTAALSGVFGEAASSFAYRVIPAWARTDPAAAAAWLAVQRGLAGLQHGIGYFLEGARAHGGSLEAIPDALPQGVFRFSLRAALVEAEARRDLTGTLARTMAMPKGFERQVALTSVAQAAMAHDDFTTIMKIGAELGWRPRRASEIRGKDVEPGLPNYGELSGSSADPFEPFHKAVRAHLENGGDPAEAWAVARASGEGIISSGHVLHTWLKRDPDAAVSAALGDPGDHTRYTHTLASAWHHVDAPAAQAFWERLPQDSPHREPFLSALANEHIDVDPAAALRWAESLPEAGRDSARKEIVLEWIDRDSREATQALLAQPDLSRDSQFVAKFIRTIIQLEDDPASAAPLLPLLPEDDTAQGSSIVYHDFAKSYSANDERAASDWIATLPEGAFKDQAISGMVEHLRSVDGDYGSALAWAGSVTGEELRERLSIDLFKRWKSIDPASARAALEQTTLPLETIERLLATP